MKMDEGTGAARGPAGAPGGSLGHEGLAARVPVQEHRSPQWAGSYAGTTVSDTREFLPLCPA